MPLYTDMIMDNFEDYANHHEDDGVIKLQNQNFLTSFPSDPTMLSSDCCCLFQYFL